jgi:4,5-DOPA dioxygenase extradiol
MLTPMPVIFFGHGNPMNALQRNAYTEGWAAIGASLPRPRAILAISAHWFMPGTAVTAMATPRTIHDFGGFPPELHRFAYTAPGDPQLAREVAELLAPTPVALDTEWGLDHGTWSVLAHVFPDADVPVVQLRIDETMPSAFHYDLAKLLAPLRYDDVLIIGSGNVVHNLHTYAWGGHPAEPFEWAVRFERTVHDLIVAVDHAPLAHYENLGSDAMLSVPTPEHFLPLLYVTALQQHDDDLTFPVKGIDGGSISMLCVRIG